MIYYCNTNHLSAYTKAPPPLHLQTFLFTLITAIFHNLFTTLILSHIYGGWHSGRCVPYTHIRTKHNQCYRTYHNSNIFCIIISSTEIDTLLLRIQHKKHNEAAVLPGKIPSKQIYPNSFYISQNIVEYYYCCAFWIFPIIGPNQTYKKIGFSKKKFNFSVRLKENKISKI